MHPAPETSGCVERRVKRERVGSEPLDVDNGIYGVSPPTGNRLDKLIRGSTKGLRGRRAATGTHQPTNEVASHEQPGRILGKGHLHTRRISNSAQASRHKPIHESPALERTGLRIASANHYRGRTFAA